MRDPNRIENTLEEIRLLWDKYPDMRLMQLIHNATGDSPAVYYIEDDVLVDGLKDFYRKLEKQ